MNKFDLPIVIGICGAAQSGKSLMATMMQAWGGNEVVYICPLSSAIKKECAKATGLLVKHFDDPKYKEALRPLMQWWGNEYRRNPLFGHTENYWLDSVDAQIETGYNHHSYRIFVVPDIRFDREALWVTSAHHHPSSTVIHIEAVNPLNVTPHSDHVSEKGISSELTQHRLLNDQANGRSVYQSLVQDWCDTNLITEA